MAAPRPEDLSTTQRMALLRQTKAVLAKQPKNVTAHFNYAMLLKADKQTGPAIQHLRKAHKLAPDDLEILSLLAETCLESRQLTIARKYARLLIEKFPKNPDCRMFMADVLEQMGKPDLALKQYEVVLKIEPNHPQVLNKMAHMARIAGDKSGIEKFQNTVKEISPLNPFTLYSEAHNRRNNEEQCAELEGRITAALEKADGPDVDNVQVSQLYFARGKIFSDVQRYDEAFEAYKRANSVLDQLIEGKDKEIFANMRSAFTRSLFMAKKNMGATSNAPIFILGMPRSGTTLTESICAAHGRVTAGDELSHISAITGAIGEDTPYKEAFCKTVNEMPARYIEQLGEHYLQKTAALRHKTPHFTDKMPHNFQRLGMIRLVLPNAAIIHCRRHPIDNCLSLFTNSMTEYHNGYKSDLTSLGLYYRQYWNLMKHWRENVPGGFLEVFYEDTVANTELVARKMIDYIGLEWEDNVMDRQKSQKSVRTLSAWQVRQPVYTSSAGRWKKYEKHLGPLIDALGPVVDEYEAELAALDHAES